jgi:hypothetical protein
MLRMFGLAAATYGVALIVLGVPFLVAVYQPLQPVEVTDSVKQTESATQTVAAKDDDDEDDNDVVAEAAPQAPANSLGMTIESVPVKPEADSPAIQVVTMPSVQPVENALMPAVAYSNESQPAFAVKPGAKLASLEPAAVNMRKPPAPKKPERIKVDWRSLTVEQMNHYAEQVGGRLCPQIKEKPAWVPQWLMNKWLQSLNSMDELKASIRSNCAKAVAKIKSGNSSLN